MITTEETWEIDGVPLNTLAYNIVSLSGNREGPPPVRGENLMVPLRPGKIWVERFPDERVITLGMWVQGSDDDGNPPDDIGLRRQFRANWDLLVRTLYTPWRQMKVTKKWRDPETGDLKSASAMANYGGGMDAMVRDGGPHRGVFTVDLVLAEPYFYDDVERVIQLDSAVNSGFATHFNPGFDLHRKLIIDFQAVTQLIGTVNEPEDAAGKGYPWTLVNRTPDPDVYFTSIEGASAGQQFRYDTLEFTARQILSPQFGAGSLVNRLGFIRHGGTRNWLLLLPGTNTIRLNVPSGERATAQIRYRPQYF